VIVGPSLVAQSSQLQFSTTDTLRNEHVDVGSISANFVISVDGTINQNMPANSGSATVVLVGGNDTFANEKQQREPMFYMSERQKMSIYAILKTLANRTAAGQISADVPILDTIVRATYTNFCG